jgi:hypothetical protein
MAVGEASEDLLRPDFFRKAKMEIEKSGFLSDEHDFAPYGEELLEHREEN